MRILHVIPGLTYEQGGTATAAHALARCQAADGHDVTVLTTDQGVRQGQRPLPPPGAARLEVVPTRGPDRLAFAAGFTAAVRRGLGRCDVAHVHSVFNYPTHAAFAAAGAPGCGSTAGVPVVHSPHGMFVPVALRRSPASALKKALYLAAWGRRLRRVVTARHYTSETERVASRAYDGGPQFVVPLGIDAAEFAVDRGQARAAVAARWPAVGDRPYVLYLGRIHPIKRPELLVAAFLAGAPADYRLVIAGPDEGGTWSRIRSRLLADPAAAARVVTTGTVIGADKANLYAAATTFALPSLTENFGLTVLEALAAGTPVLASSHVDSAQGAVAAGFAEALPVDLAVWRDRLARLPADPVPPPDFVRAARDWVRTNYAWAEIARRMVERYAWAAAGCPA